MNNTIRFSKLLGECRRQMNGAVAGSMRFYGAEYGLNYGVSLPTIRSLAKAEGRDHSYAKYLYQQQVREIQLSALHIAQPAEINREELSFWATGIINSEVAEEAAFALFQYVDYIKEWLDSPNELLKYTALLSIAKSKIVDINSITNIIINNLDHHSVLITTALIALLENYYREEQYRSTIENILKNLPPSKASSYIVEEVSWRITYP
ncbi:MAG: DNA alkylation repair protein [Rikenellaceae bacterium]